MIVPILDTFTTARYYKSLADQLAISDVEVSLIVTRIFNPTTLSERRLVDAIEARLFDLHLPSFSVIGECEEARYGAIIGIRLRFPNAVATASFMVESGYTIHDVDTLPRWLYLILHEPEWVIAASEVVKEMLT